MTEPHLTVAIPTFNRPKQLRATLLRLMPQLQPGCEVIILDNASPEPVSDLLKETGWSENAAVNSFRNPVNIGLAANIVRCFELTQSPWVVVLGDDDEITPDFVDTILQTIQNYPTAAFINFASSIHQRSSDFTCHGLSGFVERLDNWSNVLFISCSVYHRPHIAPFIRFGLIYAYTLAPHIAILLQTLRETGASTVFSSRRVVTCQEAAASTWSRLFLSNPTLLIELIPERRLQQLFSHKMASYFLPIHTVAELLIAESLSSGADKTFAFRIRALFDRGASRSVLTRARDLILEILVAYPKFGNAAITISKRLCGRKPARLPPNESTAGI